MFGLTFEKLLLIGFIAAMILGPRRLPEAAEWLAGAVRKVKSLGTDLRGRVADEMGPEFDDVDWKTLDPRRYDPRRIVREALTDIDPAPLPTRVSRTATPPSKPAAALPADEEAK
jgi:sec-independent protein translocase protein TatB